MPNRAVVVSSLILFYVVTLIPVDITFLNFDVPPKLVPYVIGMPTDDVIFASYRGDVVLGGCILNGLQASKVLVW